MLLMLAGWDIGPASHTRADALINHAKYNQTIFRDYLKPQFKYVVPTREPVSLFISAVKYFATYNVIKTGTVSCSKKITCELTWLIYIDYVHRIKKVFYQ